jgi:metal-dependent amidase/aminoacylase/carboxypeptidase family protein
VHVIPHHTAAKLLIRSEDDDYMDEVLKPKVLACFEGAAIASGCGLKYRWGEESRYKAMRTNRALAETYRTNIEALGRKVVEQETHRSMGSTDMGNVSTIVPAIHPSIAIAPHDVPVHTVEFREIAASDSGHQGLLDSAKVLAMTAIDVILDEGLRKRMREEFRASK